MQFFVFFIVGAVMLGAGAMLAPAWPTKQPRIGLAASFSLALVSGGAVFWANLFGWQTLVIDYLLFALVSLVVLGGTMAQAQSRAEARGEELLDHDIGWPGPEDLAFFGLMTLLVALPLLIFDFPPGHQAAGNAMITLAARDGATFDSLAPHYPGITGIEAPGFHALTAYLSNQLAQPIPQVHLATGALLALLCVWTAYDLGAEIQDKRLGRAMALALPGSFGIAHLYVSSYYSELMGVLFALAFAIFALRTVRHHLLADMIAAGMMLGAVMLVCPAMFVATGAGYILFLLANHLPERVEKRIPQPQPDWKAYLARWLGVPLVALIGTAPWTLNHSSDIQRLISNWKIQYSLFAEASYIDLLRVQGLWMVPVLIVGIGAGWRQHRQIIMWGISWLLVSFLLYPPDPSVIQSISIPLPNPATAEALAPIIPFALLGGFGLLWLYEHMPRTIRQQLRKRVYVLCCAALLVIGASWLFSPYLIKYAPDDIQSAVAPGDLAAMRWLADNAAGDARILNHPDGLWAAPTTGLNTALVPVPEGFFAPERTNPPEIFAFWEGQYSIGYKYDYVLLPQTVDSRPYDAQPFLERVFEQDGAAGYRVLED